MLWVSGNSLSCLFEALLRANIAILSQFATSLVKENATSKTYYLVLREIFSVIFSVSETLRF